MRLQSRLSKIEGQLHGRQQGLWDLSLLSDDVLEALSKALEGHEGGLIGSSEELIALFPDGLLQQIELIYGGQDEQA